MVTDFIKKFVKVFWLLPGFLLWASFPPMGEMVDSLFALAPLLWLSRNRDAKTSFRRWFLNGFLFWFATLSWMPAIVKNGGPWPLVVLGWGALSAYCALYFGAFGWLSAKVWAWVKDEGTAWRKPPRHPYARRLFAILVAEPVLWCGLELVRSRFLGGFAWNHLGLPLVRIITENGEEPRCDYVSCPPGCMGGGIRNATKVPGSVTILSGDEIRYASGNYKKDASGMTVKIRGNTSAYPAKKPFKIKLQKKADLLGRGNDAKYKDKEWLLLRYDQLKMLAGLKVNELIGMSWTPAFQFVNLVFNGDYRGVYMLAESVKRNEDCRLRVSKAGYVIEYDAYWWNEDVTFTNGWNPSMAYTFKYPDSDDVTPEEVAYIRKYIGRVESAIVDGTYEQRIDVVSFARWLAAHDILGSLDGAGSNMYLTKYDATDNSKLAMANLWDFDGIYQRKDTWATAHIWGANYFPTLLSSTNPAFREAYANVCEGNARTICKVTANYLKNFANSDTGKALDASLVQDNKRWHGGEVPVEQCYMVAKEWFDSRPGWLLNAVASLR